MQSPLKYGNQSKANVQHGGLHFLLLSKALVNEG